MTSLNFPFFITAFLMMTLASELLAQADHTPGPNIVLFIADDLGKNDLSCYGNRVVRTPNVQRLAEESLLFTSAFATSPTCSPSRASIHTGMYPFRHGAHANHSGIDAGVKTLPYYMKNLGYSVAIAGKYHVGPMEQYPFELIHNTNIPEKGYEGKSVLWTDLNMEPVDKWLAAASQRKKPFMLVINDHSPHVIWPETASYKPSEVDIPARHVDTGETRKMRARYYTDITKMDGNVGKLLKSLDDHQLSENTVVIFTADQGPQWAFGKWNLYDYGVNTPLLIKWPEITKEGTVSHALVSLADLLPTVVEIAGAKAPGAADEIDGRSFLPVLLNEKTAHRQHIFASHTGDGTKNQSPMRMIRTSRYKYILNLAPEILYTTHIDKGRSRYWKSWIERSHQNEHAASVLWRYHNRPAEELYDILKDPNEKNNLAADTEYQALVNEFRSQMNQWRKQQKDHESGPYQPAESDRHHEAVAPYIFK